MSIATTTTITTTTTTSIPLPLLLMQLLSLLEPRPLLPLPLLHTKNEIEMAYLSKSLSKRKGSNYEYHPFFPPSLLACSLACLLACSRERNWKQLPKKVEKNAEKNRSPMKGHGRKVTCNIVTPRLPLVFMATAANGCRCNHHLKQLDLCSLKLLIRGRITATFCWTHPAISFFENQTPYRLSGA